MHVDLLLNTFGTITKGEDTVCQDFNEMGCFELQLVLECRESVLYVHVSALRAKQAAVIYAGLFQRLATTRRIQTFANPEYAGWVACFRCSYFICLSIFYFKHTRTERRVVTHQHYQLVRHSLWRNANPQSSPGSSAQMETH